MARIAGMSKRRPSLGFAVVLAACTGVAFCQSTPPDGAARGVNPADNVTKFEMQPRFGMIDDRAGVSLTTLTVKYDRAIQGRFGVNFDLPLARFEGAGRRENGHGDANLRGRYQRDFGRMTFIAGAEVVLPVASDELLGSGKWQFNPTAAAVLPLGPQGFLAGVFKGIRSVGGDADRADLDQLQLRLLAGHISPRGWWLLVDPQYWIDRDAGDPNEFVLEAEYGRMIGPTVGIWLRAGARVGGNWNRGDWSAGGGIRFLSF